MTLVIHFLEDVYPYPLMTDNLTFNRIICIIWYSRFFYWVFIVIGGLVLTYFTANRAMQIVCKYQYAFSSSKALELGTVAIIVFFSALLTLPQMIIVQTDGKKCICSEVPIKVPNIIWTFTEVYLFFAVLFLLNGIILTVSCVQQTKTWRRQLRDLPTSSLSVHLRMAEIFEMASRMRQARDRQRESLALSDSNPGKSVANIFRHRSSSKRGHELPPLPNDNNIFLIDDNDKAELFGAFSVEHLTTESDPVPIFCPLSDRALSSIDVSSDLIKKYITCLEIWTRALEEDSEVDVVYIDFCKALNTVPHQRLLHKLSAIGIQGDLLNWIRAFLVGRKQRVCIVDDMTEWVNMTSGVPQGSVLEPLLFILYVNDNLQELDCGKIMFADDIML
nr:unnamed protein product [Spirometra erinaceieuropaei]